jgi:hypothetical protein
MFVGLRLIATLALAVTLPVARPATGLAQHGGTGTPHGKRFGGSR